MDRLRDRVKPLFPLDPPLRVLDLGAAQGVTVTCFARLGFEAEGVEPWLPAIEVSRELAQRTGIETKIVPGSGEAIPLESGSLDFVHAHSVMEHVDDPDQVFREVNRVLRPGGGFFFSTTSALCPKQFEIARFPLFPWYPPPLRRWIMDWAMDHHPHLVGNTTRPAYHWFRHRKTRRDLERAGFSQAIDRWTLRRGELEGVRGAFVEACAANRAVRFVGDLTTPGVEYLALK